jgi:hypothetical protein
MKLALSTLYSALALFILAFLFYWGVFSAGYLSSYLHIMRPTGTQVMWANIIGFIFQGFFLSFIYKYYYKGESPFKEGLLYGLFIGLLVSLPFVFFMWANYTVQWKGVLVDGIAMGIRFLVAGIVIGLAFGKKQ